MLHMVCYQRWTHMYVSRHVVSRCVDTVSKCSMTGESLLEFMYTRTRAHGAMVKDASPTHLYLAGRVHSTRAWRVPRYQPLR